MMYRASAAVLGVQYICLNWLCAALQGGLALTTGDVCELSTPV